MAGVLVSESNVYSAGRTFIKSHAHASDNYMLVLTSDDKEDLDEDGSVDIEVSPDFLMWVTSVVSSGENTKAMTKPLVKMNACQAYIFHRQLLI